MGSVYRADDVERGAPVAIKILRPHLTASEEATARFQREAFVGGRLDHPNCVAVADLGTCEDGAVYLVMELLEGEPLGAVLDRERRLPWRRALHLARHVLRGLAHAHDQGIVHRDVKPDNVFVCRRDGDADFARVLDFGIAKLVAGAAGPAITQAGLTVGTPEYLSPEQAVGGQLDGRSDLYSLSVVVYELVTGVTPFRDPNLIKILTAHTTDPPPAFRDVAPDVDVPAEVEALVMAGLAKRPDDRIESAAAYIARIDDLLAPADTVPDPGVGVVVDGRYRLDRMLGRGGMGRVYRAEHIGLGRPVAIKVLDPELVTDDDVRRRFEREAQATGRLRHANCVGVTDFGTTADGSPFLVMELIDGATLDDVLADRPRLPPARAIHIMRHLLRGLGHAHAQGLVHRDLKPANIMLVADHGDPDFVKILDFGLARLAGGDRITRTGIVCGTPRYMSPEQVHDRGVDPRADLYAASVILFEMLAGRTPFDADDTLTILKMHLGAPVPHFADVAPGIAVPPAVEALIRKGLAKQAADRPATAEAYLAALDRAWGPSDGTIELSGSLASVIVPDAPAPAPAPAPAAARRGRRPRRLAIAGGVVAALFAIGLIAAVVGGGAPSPGPTDPAAGDLELEAEPARALDPAIEGALRAARDGRGEDAVQNLIALRRTRPADPQIPYALGRVYGRLGRPKPMAESYRDAIRLDPTLREDAALIGDLVDLLATRSWELAARVIEQDVGPPAVPALTKTAAGHKDAAVRRRAERLRDRLTP
jgi:serine/threonine protein kinase